MCRAILKYDEKRALEQIGGNRPVLARWFRYFCDQTGEFAARDEALGKGGEFVDAAGDNEAAATLQFSQRLVYDEFVGMFAAGKFLSLLCPVDVFGSDRQASRTDGYDSNTIICHFGFESK